MTSPSNMIPVKVLAHSQLWANFCNNQFVRHRTGWEAGFPFYRKKNWLQSKSHWKTLSKLFTNQKLWVTYRGTKTVQDKRLQCSYVKIMFSVATKMLTRMWMSLTSCGNSRHLWFPESTLRLSLHYRDQSRSPSVGSLTALWSVWEQGLQAPGSRTLLNDKPYMSFWKLSSLRSTWLGILA